MVKEQLKRGIYKVDKKSEEKVQRRKTLQSSEDLWLGLKIKLTKSNMKKV